MEQWEYLTTFADADAKAQSQKLKAMFPDFKGKPFAPQALMPVLNELGAVGWELITCHPYSVGGNQDVVTFSTTVGTARGSMYTHTYFCAFKRRKQTA